MKILVTGSKGFVGRNLVCTLNNIKDGKDKTFRIGSDIELYEYDADSDTDELYEYCRDCDIVYHLAGVNRPQSESEYMDVNLGLTKRLLDALKAHDNHAAIVFSSSTQATLDNPYGRSKKAAEEVLRDYALVSDADVFIYRFPNIFGKWSTPNYNSVIATFCHNIAREIPIKVNDRATMLDLIYIDDVVSTLINLQNGTFGEVSPVHHVTLGEIADSIMSFKANREDKGIPNLSDSFTKKLHATYLSYLPTGGFSYPLKMNVDDRGSFTEILRTNACGQFSVNITKPHVTKGNHWHNTKNEKFLVVSGTGVIRFRKADGDEIIEYHVSGEKLEVVEIPTGYTHNIENIGETDLVTFMWCCECFDPNKPDTYYLEV